MTKGSLLAAFGGSSEEKRNTVQTEQNTTQPQTTTQHYPADSNTASMNMVAYVQSLPETIRNNIVGFLRTGEVDQDKIDMNFIEHYLMVSRHSNPLKYACETKLMSTLNLENCFRHLELAERFDLSGLKCCARELNNTSLINRFPTNYHVTPSNGTAEAFTKYTALFTCDTAVPSKRTLSTVVLNCNNEVKCFRKIKSGKRISKQFQCCCVQDDESSPPYIFWSFGKCFCKYDPVLNKCKKLPSLKYKRSKFCLVAHNQKCYAVGGENNGKIVRRIEEYDVRKKSWKVIAEIPVSCQKSLTSVVFQNKIYIFMSAMSDTDIAQNKIVVYALDLDSKTINVETEIPMSMNQAKSCVLGSKIYLASDSGDFIQFCPNTSSYIRLSNQILKCKDFGMHAENGVIILAGGINSDGKCNNAMMKFCPLRNYWERLPQKLPDCIPVYGSCEIKIPKGYSIVPFYETKFFEIS